MTASLDDRFLQQAEGYLELELPKPALESLRRVNLQRRDTFEWNWLTSEAFRQLQRYEEAIPLLELCRKLKPGEIAVYINLGWCHKRVGKLSLAIDALRSAHRQCLANKSEEEHPLVMYNLGCYYALARQPEEMLYWLDQAFKKAPQYRSLVPAESDFEAYRNDPDFQKLVREQEEEK